MRRKAFYTLLTILHQITHPQPDQEPICAIFVSSEERLFRDANATDITHCIKLCSEHGVTLVTPTYKYDLMKPGQMALLRFIGESTSQFVAQVLTSKLQAGKQRKRAQK